jgi:type II secretory pathway component HofQ
MTDIYSLIESEVPGDWNYRGDYIWRNRATNELLVIQESTMRQIKDREDSYRISIHEEDAVKTIVDNESKERCKKIAKNYIKNGEVPEDSWITENGETNE